MRSLKQILGFDKPAPVVQKPANPDALINADGDTRRSLSGQTAPRHDPSWPVGPDGPIRPGRINADGDYY